MTHDDDLRVLIVEDEPRMRDMLLRALPEMGFEPVAVGSAEAALRVMREAPAGAILLDLHLPGMDGMTFFEQVTEKWPDVRVVIMTGYGDLDAARRAIHLDVVDFLTKPCTLGDIETALGRARGDRLAPRSPPPPPEPPEPTADHAAGPRPLHDLEREHIEQALDRHDGNRSAAAEELGISVRTLYYRVSNWRDGSSSNT